MSLHHEIHSLTSSADSARTFLTSRGILKTSVTCSCSTSMVLMPCSSSKSPDLYIWKCPGCKKFKNLRTDTILSGSNLTLKQFLTLLFYLSIRSLSNVEISALTGLSEKTAGQWRSKLSDATATWLLANCTPLGGPGKVVEIDEAKFGKRKYNKGAYREGMWVLGGVDRETGYCFLVPCPGNKRDAQTLLPIIQRWVLPGSVVYTDEWAAYNGLTANSYTHDAVNHSVQFVDPITGVHTNTQEGLWHHVKRKLDGSKDLGAVLVDFMFRRLFHASAGVNQISNAFNGYLTVLAA